MILHWRIFKCQPLISGKIILDECFLIPNFFKNSKLDNVPELNKRSQALKYRGSYRTPLFKFWVNSKKHTQTQSPPMHFRVKPNYRISYYLLDTVDSVLQLTILSDLQYFLCKIRISNRTIVFSKLSKY